MNSSMLSRSILRVIILATGLCVVPSIARAADPIPVRQLGHTVSRVAPKDSEALYLFAIGSSSSGKLLRIANDSQGVTYEPSARLAACYVIHRRVLTGYMRMHACPLFVADAGSPTQTPISPQLRHSPFFDGMTGWFRTRVGAASAYLAG